MRGGRASRALAAMVGAVVTASACASVLGIDRDYRPRPTSELEGGADATAEAAGPTVLCGDAAVTSCLGCVAGGFLCPETSSCVADCVDECAGAPVECLACDGDRRALVAAACEPRSDAGACAAPPLAHCECTEAADCQGPRQVCAGGSCLACGEPTTHGAPCKAPPGKKCDADNGGKVEDETTCH